MLFFWRPLCLPPAKASMSHLRSKLYQPLLAHFGVFVKKTDQKLNRSAWYMLYCFKNVWVRPIHLYVKSITPTASQVTAALFKITHVKRRLQYDSHMFPCKSVISCAIHIHSFRNLFQRTVWSVAIGYRTCLSMLSICGLWLTNIPYIWTFIFKTFSGVTW